MDEKGLETTTVVLPTALLRVVLPVLEQCSDRLGNAGCNDYMIPDTPTNRLLSEVMDARSFGMTLEAYRESDDYCDPAVHKGELVIQDISPLDHLRSLLTDSLPTDGDTAPTPEATP